MRASKRDIPILLGNNYEHVMGRADIVEEGDEIIITVRAKGREAGELASLLTAMEPMALSFVGVPLQSHRSKKESS